MFVRARHAGLLSKNTHLQRVSFRANTIRKPAVPGLAILLRGRCIVPALGPCCEMVELGATGAACVTTLPACSCSLCALDLGENKLGIQGALGKRKHFSAHDQIIECSA